MKYLIFFVLFASAVYLSSCDNAPVQSAYDPNALNFSIKPVDYSETHYMFDTIYRKSFLEYFNSVNSQYSSYLRNNTIESSDPSFEVWVEEEPSQTIDVRYASAWTMLYEMPSSGYQDTLNGGNIRGKVFTGYFRKLTSAEYFMYNEAGFIRLKVNVPPSRHVGVAYKTFEGKTFGTASTNFMIAPQDTLILKMIKAGNLDPNITPEAWELQMKNIYPLQGNKITSANLYITFIPPSSVTGSNSFPNDFYSVATRLKIDRYTGRTKNGPHDGAFDFLPGFTINTETGDIIFPSLRPFYDEVNAAGYPQYSFPELYSMKKINAMDIPNAGRYLLSGWFVSSPD